MLVVVLLLALRVMPFEFSIVFAKALVELYTKLSGRARIQLALAEKALGKGRFSRKIFIDNAASNLALMARMGTAFSRGLTGNALIEGEGYVRRFKDEGSAGVVATFHYGPWELLAEAFTQKGYRVGALVGRQRMGLFDSYLGALRRRTGLVSVHNLDEAKRILNRGFFLTTLLDKTRRAKGLSLGVPYPDYKASVLGEYLSRKTKTPLLPVTCRFEKKRLLITVGKPDSDLKEFFAPFFEAAPYHWLVWGN